MPWGTEARMSTASNLAAQYAAIDRVSNDADATSLDILPEHRAIPMPY